MLEVKDLGLKLEGKQIFENVSFSVGQGELLAICGPNGSGKSCLLKTIKGLLKQSCGSVLVDGKEQDCSERLLSTGLVFQDADVQTVGETVEKDIAFGPRNLRWTDEKVKQSIEEVIELLNMQKYRKMRPQVLSGGEKRCLAIAGVLAMHPGIVMMDEVFSNLDYPSVQMVLKAVLKLKKEGIAVVIVSHDIDCFLAYADKVLVVDDGKAVYFGKPEASLEVLKKHSVHVSDIPLEKMTWL
jgi:biotin transport system ATP-binding protein